MALVLIHKQGETSPGRITPSKLSTQTLLYENGIHLLYLRTTCLELLFQITR